MDTECLLHQQKSEQSTSDSEYVFTVFTNTAVNAVSKFATFKKIISFKTPLSLLLAYNKAKKKREHFV